LNTCILAIFAAVRCTAQPLPSAQVDAEVPIVRCAVIGGMHDTDFWPQLADRFTRQTGIRVELAATGPKQEIARAFIDGDVDLITMHASDTIINLVADGYGEDPQPWARNDLILVGPESDPAGIRGQADAVAALARLIDSKATILMHSSLGANEVLRDLLAEGELELDPDHTVVLPSDRHRQMLIRAAEMEAYTIVGRIPFLNGKIDHEGLAVMVQGDVRLRRPYVVVVATADRVGAQQNRLARQLAAFLRREETQDWIAKFGIGEFDIHPLFFPVKIGRPRFTFNDQIAVDAESLGGLERKRIRTEDRGKEVEFEGVLLADLLKRQGVPTGEQLRGTLAELVVVAEARDHYRAAFSLAELDPATGGKEVLIADRRDGRPLDEQEGPYRLVIPDEARHVRWVRMLQSLRVTRPSPINVDPTRKE
jgi:tungstate transport system substrate-binding protein